MTTKFDEQSRFHGLDNYGDRGVSRLQSQSEQEFDPHILKHRFIPSLYLSTS